MRLPLSQGAVVGLIDALLVEDHTARGTLLEGILRHDAPLMLWTCCRAQNAVFPERATIHSYAAWLAPRLADELRGLDRAQIVIDRPRSRQLAGRAERAARDSEACARLARKMQGRDVEPARLAGLLRTADEWLTACGARHGPRSLEVLPDWLRALVLDLRKKPAVTSGESPLAALVRQAQADTGRQGAVHASPKRAANRWRFASADEVARLASLADRLARLAELEVRFAEMLETEKLEALAELAAGAGHEFNPPLAVISGRAQLFLREEQDAERRRELAVINRQALRVHEMVADLMHFARPARPRLAECDVVALVREAIAGLQSIADERRIALDFSASDDELFAELDATQMQVAVRAVVTNSLEAIGTEGRVEVHCALQKMDESELIEIKVSDDGPGITAEVRRHLFDPFYSGRGAGRGLGLGLSKCWRIVTNHAGRVDVASEPGAGTIVRLTLPVRQST